MDDSIKLKRQIEILGLLIMNKKIVYKNFDLASLFAVSNPTIDRDLRELRERGIDIHSTVKDGIVIQNNVKPELLKELLLQYLVFNYADYMIGLLEVFFPYGDIKLVLQVLVKLQKAIDNKNNVTVILKEESKYLLRGLHYNPRLIFKNDNEWCLLLTDKSDFIIIPIGAISDVIISENTFNVIHRDLLLEEIRKLTGKDMKDRKYKIKLAFKELKKDTIPRNLTKVRFYSEDGNGTINMEAEVDSLDDIAGWVFSQSYNLLFIQPPELSDKIFKLINEYLKISKRKTPQKFNAIFEDGNIYSIRNIQDFDEFKRDLGPIDNQSVCENRILNYKRPSFIELDFSLDLNICTN